MGIPGVPAAWLGRCSKKSCDLSSTAATKIYQVAAVIVAGFDNETLAKVFQHVTGTGRREVDSDTSNEKCHVHVYTWPSPMILRCHMTWEFEVSPWHHAICRSWSSCTFFWLCIKYTRLLWFIMCSCEPGSFICRPLRRFCVACALQVC